MYICFVSIAAIFVLQRWKYSSNNLQFQAKHFLLTIPLASCRWNTKISALVDITKFCSHTFHINVRWKQFNEFSVYLETISSLAGLSYRVCQPSLNCGVCDMYPRVLTQTIRFSKKNYMDDIVSKTKFTIWNYD